MVGTLIFFKFYVNNVMEKYFSGNMLSSLIMPVELWHAWVLENFNNQKPEFYAR